MVESVATALLIYLGQKTIDRFWGAQRTGNSSFVDNSGKVQSTNSDAGRTAIRREFTVSKYQESELIVGEFLMENSIQEALMGNEVPLVLVVEQSERQSYLFQADLSEGYEIYLPHGNYEFFVFLVDGDAPTLFDAEIYAHGFWSAMDVSDIEEIQLDDAEDVWNLVNLSPISIMRGGPYYLDFILIDTGNLPEFPQFFSELV